MPPKKRALEESNANAQPIRDSKQQKRSQSEQQVENHGLADTNNSAGSELFHCLIKTRVLKELNNRKPEEYICIDQPAWGHNGQSDDEDNEAHRQADASGKPQMWPKPASEHPEWKWTMMCKSWKLLCDYSIRARYTIPDDFDMYIYNDFHGYGMIELAENAVAEFHAEHRKAVKDRSLHLMWAPIAMLGYWLNNDNMDEMVMVDDGDRVYELCNIMGNALLAALNSIDRAGKLTKDSEFLDLGLVMTLFLKWSHGWDDADKMFKDDEDEIEEEIREPWKESVVGYAKKAGIDLRAAGCALSNGELDNVEDAEPLKKSSKADRWNWKRTFKEYADHHGVRKGKIGGQQYDITKMSSIERAAHAFDKVDPLKDAPADVLKENRLDWA